MCEVHACVAARAQGSNLAQRSVRWSRCCRQGLHPNSSTQVKWAAHLPYAQAVALLGEVLPIADVVSVSGLKRRVRAVGAALESGQILPVSDTAEDQFPAQIGGVPTSVALD